MIGLYKLIIRGTRVLVNCRSSVEGRFTGVLYETYEEHCLNEAVDKLRKNQVWPTVNQVCYAYYYGDDTVLEVWKTDSKGRLRLETEVILKEFVDQIDSALYKIIAETLQRLNSL